MNEYKTFEDVLVGAVTLERDYASRFKGLASALYALAQSCKSVDEFKDSCTAAEQWIRSDEAGSAKLEVGVDLPRAWKQAKSDIAGGMNRGLDPTKFDTYSQFKQAKADAGKAAEQVANVDKPEKDTHSMSVVDSQPDEAMKKVLQDLVPVASCLVQLPDVQYSGALRKIKQLAETARGAHLSNQKKGGQHKQAGKQQATG